MEESIVIILSTPTCVKCKSMIPRIKDICEEYNISYVQHNALEDGMKFVRTKEKEYDLVFMDHMILIL